MTTERFQRLLKYSLVGVTTFLFDLSLLWILTDFIHLNYLLAAFIAFFVAVSINYFVSRHKVFKSSERGLREGYLYFLLIVSAGVLIMLGLMYVFVSLLHLNILIARTIVAGFVGLFNFFVNDKFNFKM